MIEIATKFVEKITGNKKYLTALMLIFLIAGFCSRFFLRHDQPLRESLGGLCDALFIASFVTIVVDPLLKKTFLREATRDVFSFIYGYGLPQELRDFVNNVVLKATFLRRQCKLEWEVQPVDGDAGKVGLRLNASFLIENITNEVHKYQHKVVAWSESPADLGSVEDLYCQDQSISEQLYLLTKNDFQADSDGYVKGEEVELLPITHSLCHQYRMGAHYYSESGIEGLDVFAFEETTADVEVTVSVDSAFRDFAFSITPTPPGDPQHRMPKLDGASRTYRCHWTFKRVFVPNETLIIRWKRQP